MSGHGWFLLLVVRRVCGISLSTVRAQTSSARFTLGTVRYNAYPHTPLEESCQSISMSRVELNVARGDDAVQAVYPRKIDMTTRTILAFAIAAAMGASVTAVSAADGDSC